MDTKTILSNVRNIGSISSFDAASYGGVDRVVEAESGVMVALKRMDRLFIIPRPEESEEVYKFVEVTSFNVSKVFPQDIIVVSNMLFVLDFYKGVYVY